MVNTKELLVTIKKAIIDIEEKKKEATVYKQKINECEKDIKDLEKTRENAKETAVRDARKEIDNYYNALLIDNNKKLKEANNAKAKERKKNLQELAAKETAGLNESNKYLKEHLKTIVKEKKLPKIVASKGYMLLFKYKTPKEVTLAILIGLLLCIGIPAFLSFIIFAGSPNYVKIVIFIAFILLFGGIYLAIDKFVNVDEETEKEIKDLNKQIGEYDKQIKKITKEVMNDKDDSKFDYTEIDREIETLNLELNRIKEEKTKTLENFENNTKQQIIDKIIEEAKPEIEDGNKELEELKEVLARKEKEYDELQNKLEEDYKSTVGKDNLTLKQIDKLIDIINNNEGMTLQETIANLK